MSNSSVPGARPVAMINGRAWEFTHEGARYQIVSLHGSDVVRLYVHENGEWRFGHARDTFGDSAALVARHVFEDITAPVGVDYARECLVYHTGYHRDYVREMSNNEVIALTAERFPGGWDGLLRHIGAV